MDDLLARLSQLTTFCVQNINYVRDDQIMEIVMLRDELLEWLTVVDLNVNEKESYRLQILPLLEWDSVLLNRASELRKQAADQLGKLQQLSQQRTAYDGEHPSAEGSFFDQKK